MNFVGLTLLNDDNTEQWVAVSVDKILTLAAVTLAPRGQCTLVTMDAPVKIQFHVTETLAEVVELIVKVGGRFDGYRSEP